jgi:hypothetical protein
MRAFSLRAPIKDTYFPLFTSELACFFYRDMRDLLPLWEGLESFFSRIPNPPTIPPKKIGDPLFLGLKLHLIFMES